MSGTSTEAASAVSVAGSSEATAYVWGGASGNCYGQPVELWSQSDEVRITANEGYPPAPPGYIFTYTIPKRYVGLTFVGVTPGTTTLETQNQIRVGFDSPSAAQARGRQYASQPVLPSAKGRPSAISADLWVRLLNFSKRYEGPTDFMYNDKSTPNQLVTCGVGKMFSDVTAALNHKRFFVNVDGAEPSADEMQADFAAVQGLKRTEKNLYDFATITLLRLPWDSVTDLLGSFMGAKVNSMLAMPSFANFASFPQDAQLACASIAYGGWSYRCFAPLRDAVAASNWSLAATVYQSPGWDPHKDAAHVALFRSAAGK